MRRDEAVQPCSGAVTPERDSALASPLLHRARALPAGLALLGCTALGRSSSARNHPPGPRFSAPRPGRSLACERAISKLRDSTRPHWQLHFWPDANFFFWQKNAVFLFPGVTFYLRVTFLWFDSVYNSGVLLLACEVHSNCTLKNFFNEPSVPPYCQPRVCVDWFPCFCDCQKKAGGFCDWFSLLTINSAGNALKSLIGCSNSDLIVLVLWVNSLWCLITWLNVFNRR